MRKRIISMMLLICTCLTLMATAVSAAEEETSKAIQLGTDVLKANVNTNDAKTVYFGRDNNDDPGKWRVIGYDGSGVISIKGIMTLLSASNMGHCYFEESNKDNSYANSDLKKAVDNIAEKLTEVEKSAVVTRVLTVDKYNKNDTDGIAGELVKFAAFWPLSTKEANKVNENIRRLAPTDKTSSDEYLWWLRSPGPENHLAACVRADGSVAYYGGFVGDKMFPIGVRPAFYFNLINTVLFTSAAKNGKSALGMDGSLMAVSDYSGSEWKLTLLDNNRKFSIESSKFLKVERGGRVNIRYTGAKSGDNEYVSAMIIDNGTVLYYGRIANCSSSGTAKVTIPWDIEPGKYTLKIFSEQYNGDEMTDYASNFVDMELTVEGEEQYSLTPGDTYYFDLSDQNIAGEPNPKLPDTTLSYVPFTYVGKINAYKLTEEMVATEEYADQNKYDHSLFIANRSVTRYVSWDELDEEDLIFGKAYESGGVDYILRAPSAGSYYEDVKNLLGGVPISNEWDTILRKGFGTSVDYIQNWNETVFSHGQDTRSDNVLARSSRGLRADRFWSSHEAGFHHIHLGYRPVLEVRNSVELDFDTLRVVTINLNEYKLNGNTEVIQIVVRKGSAYTAPTTYGLNTQIGFTIIWVDGDGNTYAPGERVPADVTDLTVQRVPIYTITFDPNGGTLTGENTTYTDENCKLTSLPTPEHDDVNYKFTGWYSKATDGELVTVETIFNEDTTLYAHWTYTNHDHDDDDHDDDDEDHDHDDDNHNHDHGRERYLPMLVYYDLSFDTNGGSRISDESFLYGVKVDLSEYIPTRSGYTFTGWYSDIGLTDPIASVRMSGNKTVYAGWHEEIDEDIIDEWDQETDDEPHDELQSQDAEDSWTDWHELTEVISFDDVGEYDWFRDDVMFVYGKEMMLGTSDITFNPYGMATRSMIATILWRMEGSPSPMNAPDFADVDHDVWYSDAVAWVTENGIYHGYGDGRFGPNDPVTREQLAAIFCRYANYKRYDVIADGSLDQFDDGDTVSDWAREALKWVIGSGLINGKTDGTLDPQGTANRAEIAAILHRFIERYVIA